MSSSVNTAILFIGLMMFFSFITGTGVFDKSFYDDEELSVSNILIFFKLTFDVNVWTPVAVLSRFVVGTIIGIFLIGLARGFSSG